MDLQSEQLLQDSRNQLLHEEPVAELVNILEANDEQLSIIGKAGIFNHNEEISREEYISQTNQELLRLGEFFEKENGFFKKVRRGPLALDLSYMKSVQDYFKNI